MSFQFIYLQQVNNNLKLEEETQFSKVRPSQEQYAQKKHKILEQISLTKQQINKINKMSFSQSIKPSIHVQDQQFIKSIQQINQQKQYQQVQIDSQKAQSYHQESNNQQIDQSSFQQHKNNTEMDQDDQLMTSIYISSKNHQLNTNMIKQNDYNLNQQEDLEKQQNLTMIKSAISDKSIKSLQQKQQQQQQKQQLHIQKDLQNKQMEYRNQNSFYISISSQPLYPSLQLSSRASLCAIQPISQIPLPECIKIVSYHTQIFLRFQTQIFEIQVIFSLDQHNYKIQRRYSQFLFLFQSIIINHLGFLVYPFPQKTIENFIKIKMAIMTTQDQKHQMIQKRLGQLQNFVNFIINHQKLKYSQQLATFLCDQQEIYTKSKERIERYVEQYNQLQKPSTYIIKTVGNGLQLLKSWLSKGKNQKPPRPTYKSDQISAQDIQFGQYLQRTTNYLSVYQKLLINYQQLLITQSEFNKFNDINTDIDQLLKLCTRVSSGKQYCKFFILSLQNDIIPPIQFYLKWLRQTKHQLEKRHSLTSIVKQIEYNQQLRPKMLKLKRRIDRFDNNFRYGFHKFIQQVNSKLQYNKNQFKKVWAIHAEKMSKIWKK